jgi:transposase InsO family protein
VRRLLAELEVATLFIEPGSPWENGYIESFNGKLRDELPQSRGLPHSERGSDLDRTVATRVAEYRGFETRLPLKLSRHTTRFIVTLGNGRPPVWSACGRASRHLGGDPSCSDPSSSLPSADDIVVPAESPLAGLDHAFGRRVCLLLVRLGARWLGGRRVPDAAVP